MLTEQAYCFVSSRRVAFEQASLTDEEWSTFLLAECDPAYYLCRFISLPFSFRYLKNYAGAYINPNNF
jgi:hypothetical protein